MTEHADDSTLAPDVLDQFPGLDDQNLRVNLLIEHLGFTPDEAAAYVAGDATLLAAVANRRLEVADSVVGTITPNAEHRP